jgi:Mn2+/Fe2+ NRAMP family transporter
VALRKYWRTLGPGLIAGAADDDPSSIATYWQAGAQFGFQLAWTLFLAYPLVIVIQLICARIGLGTGRGLAGNMRRYYPRWLLAAVVALLFVVNTINIGADLGAMGEAMHLLVPAAPTWACVVGFGIACTAFQFLLRYSRYLSLLKVLSLSLFAYLAVLFAAHISWRSLLQAVLQPPLAIGSDYLLMFVAVLGTSISPYLFFWHAAQEAEGTYNHHMAAREVLPRQRLARIRLDTLCGMGLACVVALCVLTTAAATLSTPRVGPIGTVGQAAEALRPIAGSFAALIFAVGCIGTGLISIPVLAGSAAYAFAEASGWPGGISRNPLQAKAFYGVIAAATLLGTLGNLAGVNVVKALIGAAVVNGILAAPVMALLMIMSSRAAVMGDYRIPPGFRVLGWCATALMGLSAIFFLLFKYSSWTT